ncbi:MAG TPA: hypothetical protein VIP51_11225 [Eoetvoesiella sp.]
MIILIRAAPTLIMGGLPGKTLPNQALVDSLMTDTVVLVMSCLHDSKPSIAALAFYVKGLDQHIQYYIGQASAARPTHPPLTE